MPRPEPPANGSSDAAASLLDEARGALPFYAMAFFSGLAALIYEVTWAKMLALTFGSTTQATAAVVAGFLGGMGLGAWAYQFVASRAKRPVLLYAALEIGIAVSTALLTSLFYALPGVFAQLDLSPAAYAVVRFGAIFLLLLGPSMLIGATFPALCAVMIHSAGAVDRRLGRIYGINTIGAAAGVLVAGLVLVEHLGLSVSVRIANVVNLVVGIAAIVLLRTTLGSTPPLPPRKEDLAIPTTLPRVITGIVLVGSGFCTLAYEIVWFRAMRYLTGTSTYAFTIILFTFLIGLGLGSLLLQRVARRPSPERDFAWCQCAVAVLALAAMAMQLAIQSMPGLVDHVSIFSGSVRYSPWWQRLLIDAGLAFATMLPATIFMGLSFPLGTRLFLGDVGKLDTRVGTAYLLANIGSIIGAIAGAAILLPIFGTIGGTKVTAAINVALAVLILFSLRRSKPGLPVPVIVTGVVVLVFLAVLPRSIAFRAEHAIDDLPGTVVFTEEGDLATVQVVAHPEKPGKIAMSIDGYKIGWSDAFRGTIFYRKQILLAHLPMVLDARIRRTLNIGLGSSATLKTLASYPQIERLDCVEINGAVARGAALFPESVVLKDPRVSLHIDDAVHYLLRTDQLYDVIVSDGKQDPLYSGNAVLLSREFYQYAHDRLTDNGMLVQWIPLGSLHVDFKTTVRTFSDVFPHTDVFFFPPTAVLMVGGSVPLSGRPRLSQRDYETLPVGRDLAEYLLPNAGALLAHWVAGRRQLANTIGEGPMSTWDRLDLEFTPFKASAADWLEASPKNLDYLIRAEQIAEAGAGPAMRKDETPFRESAALLRRASLASLIGDTTRARAFAAQALTRNPDDPEARFLLDRLQPK